MQVLQAPADALLPHTDGHPAQSLPVAGKGFHQQVSSKYSLVIGGEVVMTLNTDSWLVQGADNETPHDEGSRIHSCSHHGLWQVLWQEFHHLTCS